MPSLPTDRSLDVFVDAQAALLGLRIAAEYRPGVRHYLALAAAMAELVEGLALGVHDEPAVVFRPVAPDRGESR